jgi:hypothetical protein
LNKDNDQTVAIGSGHLYDYAPPDAERIKREPFPVAGNRLFS